MREVLDVLKPIINTLNLDYTCENVYTAVVAGSGVTLFMSLIPGASSISSLATKVTMAKDYFYFECLKIFTVYEISCLLIKSFVYIGCLLWCKSSQFNDKCSKKA